MEITIWFILTLLVTLSIGLVAFINKIFAEKKYNPQFSAMVLYAIMFVLIGVYVVFKGLIILDVKNLLLTLFWGVQIYSYSILMMLVLKYLPTSTFFISARLSSSFLLLLVGIFFFNDIISSFEIIGFLLGVLAMLLLLEKENKKDADYKKGLLLLLLAILSLVIGHSITKILSVELNLVPSVLFFTFLFALISSFIFSFKQIKQNKHLLKPILKINIVQGPLYLFYFFILFYVYNMGDLGISYKVMSYSPFIPIILSSIIYKEKITKKKKLAIFLSILSLWFFM